MKIITLKELKENKQVVKCPKGDFVSNRFLLEKDNRGYSITKTNVVDNTKGDTAFKNEHKVNG